MADKHSITFDTGLDNSDLEKDLQKAVQKIQKATEVKGEATGKRLKLLEEAKVLGARLDEANAKLYAMRDAENVSSTAIKKQSSEVAAIQKEWNRVNTALERQEEKIKEADALIGSEREKVVQLREQMEAPGEKIKEGFSQAAESAQKLEQRVAKLASRVFVFTLITAALRAARGYFGELLGKNKEFQAEVAKLRAALATAFQPLYEAALPVLIRIVQFLTTIATIAANVMSLIFGKTLSQSTQNAKALNKQAAATDKVAKSTKEATKQLASFDEINQLSDNRDAGTDGSGPGESAGTSGMDFDGLETDKLKNKIDELTVYVAGAALAIGAILAFSGVNIPLGLALMAFGALAIISVVKENWGKMNGELKDAIAKTAAALSWGLLVIGAALAFSGINIPLGIALMAAGAIGLAATATLRWDAIANTLKNPIAFATAYISTALLVLGALLAFSGVNLPLGIALMTAGAVGLVAVGALDWDAIRKKLSETWNGIRQWWNSNVAPKLTRQFWNDKLSAIGDSVANTFNGAVNAAKEYMNRLIRFMNGIELSIEGLTIGGVEVIPSFSLRPFNIPEIPMLAKGAVIPPNAPFMAMLGDQRRGNNIEAPEELIRKIVREESGSADAELMREQNELLRQILAKTGTYLDGRKLTDTVTSYQKRDAMARGV